MSELTARQEYILDLVEQIQAADELAEAAKVPWHDAEAKANRLKKVYQEAVEAVKDLQDELKKARADRPFQPSLFDRLGAPNGLAKAVREKNVPISELGMTEKETDLLEGAGIKTIQELEKRMRTNEHWYREIKGFGQAKIDKLSDKLVEFRRRHPVPEPEPPKASEPTAPAAPEPATGVPVDAFERSEKIEIKLPKKTKAHAEIRVVEATPGKWYAAGSTGGVLGKHGVQGEALSDETLQAYDSRTLALEAAAERMVDWWNTFKKDPIAREVAQAIFAWRNSLATSADAPDEPDDLDADGNFVFGFDSITVPTSVEGARLLIRLRDCVGRWHGGITVAIGDDLHQPPVGVKSPSFASREACLLFYADQLAKFLISDGAPDGADECVADVLKFKSTINSKS